MSSASRPSSGAPRILVIRRRYLGDLVLLGSVLRNLHLHWPGAQVTLLAEPGYAAIAALNPDVATILTFPRRLAEWPRLLATLRRARFTHVLDFDNTDKTAWLTRWTGAAVRATYDRETNPYRHRWVYTHSAPVTNAFYTSQHITETYLALPAAIGQAGAHSGAVAGGVFFADWMMAMLPTMLGLMVIGYLLGMKLIFPLEPGEGVPRVLQVEALLDGLEGAGLGIYDEIGRAHV
jgi:hypothetical protein